MNISKVEVDELNKFLKDPKIILPDFKRVIGPSGNNYKWLQNHILDRNPNIDPKIKELLHIN